MYNKIRVNKFISNCYIYKNGRGLLSKLPFTYSSASLPYIMPALPHFSAGFFVLKI